MSPFLALFFFMKYFEFVNKTALNYTVKHETIILFLGFIKRGKGLNFGEKTDWVLRIGTLSDCIVKNTSLLP